MNQRYKKFACEEAREAMSELIEELKACQINFIRCVKLRKDD